MPFHPLWLILILVVVLIIFGPGRLPEIGSAAGRAMREFRKATDEIKEEVTKATSTEPSQPAAVAPAAPPAQPAPAEAPAPSTTTPETGAPKA